MDSILRVTLGGVPWKSLPARYAAGSTAHDRYLEWRDAGVFLRLWAAELLQSSGKSDIRRAPRSTHDARASRNGENLARAPGR